MGSGDGNVTIDEVWSVTAGVDAAIGSASTDSDVPPNRHHQAATFPTG